MVIKLLPLTLAVFIGFLVIGMQLPVLPLHLHDTLGMDTLVVGLVVGSQFAAALLSRSWAGNYADMRGAKRAVVAGSVAAAASGLLYLASLAFLDAPTTSVWILVAGRILLAMGESLIVTGAMGWGIGLVGPQNAGKVMAWNGIAMYGAYALGAPAGVVVNGLWGFNGISVATLFVPMLALAVVAGVRGIAPTSQRRTPFYKVLSAVWAPGMGLALSSVGFGVITAFIALLFAAKDWGNASLAFTAFGVAFIGARLFFGHLPDKIGGAKVALVCVIIEAAGQLLIWARTRPSWPTSAPRSPASATRWPSPASAWKPCAARRRRPAAWQWAPTSRSWTCRWASPARWPACWPMPAASLRCTWPAPPPWPCPWSWP